MDLQPYLLLKLLDLGDTVTTKGLSAELQISVDVAQEALNKFVRSLSLDTSAAPNSVYYYVELSENRVVLRCRAVAAYMSAHRVFAVAPKVEVQNLVECDIEYLLGGRYPTRIRL